MPELRLDDDHARQAAPLLIGDVRQGRHRRFRQAGQRRARRLPPIPRRHALHLFPGKLELAIAEAAAGLGLKYEMWPLKDTCDILIHLPDGRQLAVDAKAYGRAERLAREIEDDTGIAQMCADEVAYVVPDQVERDHPGYRALCNAVLRGKTGYSCETLRNFSKRLDAAAKGGTR